jgi:proliferating cell nuclear antigen
MMKIEQKKLASFCETLAALVPECRLTINQDGWNTGATDTANVAMVMANLPKASFEEFQCTEKTEIGVDVQKWTGMLRIMSDPKSTIEITVDGSRINISDGRYAYTLAMLDVNTVRKRPTPPNLSLPASTVTGAKEFNEALKAMAVIADKVRLTADKDGITLDAEGDSDHLSKPLAMLDGSKAPDQKISSLFSLDYLRDIGKAMKDAGNITILMGQDHPVRFDFELGGMETAFLVAPRIEEGGAA